MSAPEAHSDEYPSDAESTTSTQTTATTSQLIPGIPRFFGCYLLVSASPEPRSKNRTYIGFTVNPVRRLRQHNGELKNGGAKRTSRHRPWKMVAVIHGFDCRIQALAFEWAWTNPGRTRSLAAQRGVRFPKSPRGQLAVISALCNARPWRSCPLTLSVTVDRSTWDQLRGRTEFPDTLRLDFRAHGALGDLSRYDFRVGSGAAAPREGGAGGCALCRARVHEQAAHARAQCAACGVLSCLACFAECVVGDAESAERIVPDIVFCPACKTTMSWAMVVRLSRALAAEATMVGSGAVGGGAGTEDTSAPAGTRAA